MVRCSVLKCTNTSCNKSPDITFHRFPTDKFKRDLWIKNINRTNWQPKSNYVLCSKHFEPRLLVRKQNVTVLDPGALPTLFVDGIKSDTKTDIKLEIKEETPSSSNNLLNEESLEVLPIEYVDKVKDEHVCSPAPANSKNAMEDPSDLTVSVVSLEVAPAHHTNNLVCKVKDLKDKIKHTNEKIKCLREHNRTSRIQLKQYSETLTSLKISKRELILRKYVSQERLHLFPKIPVPEDSRGVTAVADHEGGEETKADVAVKEEKHLLQPSTSTSETVIKKEIDEELLYFKSMYFKQLEEFTALKNQQLQENQALIETNKRLGKEMETLIETNRKYANEGLLHKAMYYKLLDEHTALKNQQHQENQALIETNRSLGNEMEALTEKNRKYANDMQQLASENQRLTEKNHRLAESLQHLSEKIQELTKNESSTRESVDIFTLYIEKIENLNEKVWNLTEENKNLIEKSRSFEIKSDLQKKVMDSIKNSCNHKLESKSREIKALRKTITKLKAVEVRLRRTRRCKKEQNRKENTGFTKENT